MRSRTNRALWLLFGFGAAAWLLWATVLALVLLGVPGETTRGDWVFAINTYVVCPVAFLLVARCLLTRQMDLVTMGVILAVVLIFASQGNRFGFVAIMLLDPVAIASLGLASRRGSVGRPLVLLAFVALAASIYAVADGRVADELMALFART